MAIKTQSTGRLRIERCSNAKAWDEFVIRNDGPSFALWGWGDAAELYGHDRWYLIVCEQEAIVGGIPLVHMNSRLFGSQLVSPPFGERGSILLDDDSPAGTRDLLIERTKELADELAVDFVSLRGRDIGQHEGFSKQNRFVTFQISLRDGEEAVWDGLKSSRQRQVRQADENESLEYSVGDSIEDLRDYYRLNLRSERGHGSPPHSFEFFRTLWDRLFDDGHLRLDLLRNDGDLINGMLHLSLGSTVYQWGVITDYEYRDLNGGSYLLWKALKRACANGHDTYEFGRTREGSGVYMFKKSFGGSKTWYDDYHYFPGDSTTLPHPEKEAYEPIKRVWRRLPIPVTRAIGPRIRGNVSL